MIPFFFAVIPLVFGTLIGLIGNQLPPLLESVIGYVFFPVLFILTVVAAVVTSVLAVLVSANKSK